MGTGKKKINHANDRHHLPATPLAARSFEVLVSVPASLEFAGLNEQYNPLLNTAGGLAGAEWAVHQPPTFCPSPSTSHLRTLFICFIVQAIFRNATYLKHRFTYFSSIFYLLLFNLFKGISEDVTEPLKRHGEDGMLQEQLSRAHDVNWPQGAGRVPETQAPRGAALLRREMLRIRITLYSHQTS